MYRPTNNVDQVYSRNIFYGLKWKAQFFLQFHHNKFRRRNMNKTVNIQATFTSD